MLHACSLAGAAVLWHQASLTVLIVCSRQLLSTRTTSTSVSLTAALSAALSAAALAATEERQVVHRPTSQHMVAHFKKYLQRHMTTAGLAGTKEQGLFLL